MVLTIHMVSSLDGFVAKRDNSVEWFETPDHFEQGLDPKAAFADYATVDCYVMGARTYEHAFELSKKYGWPYGDTPTVVLTHRELPVNRKSVEFYAGDLGMLVEERLKPKFKTVWLVGGPDIAKAFLQAGLVDEIRQNILPILLGDGVPFYDAVGLEQALHLKDVKAYQSGLVELCYEVRRG
jgi:dihydrofolate reductase